jgi:hypothetical protein
MSLGGQRADNDRVLYRPIITAVGYPLSFIVASAIGGALLAALVLPFWAYSGVRAAVKCITWGAAREWYRFWSTAVLPLSVLVAAINFTFVWDIAGTAGSYLHFFVLYPSYVAEIARLPTDRPRLKVWQWISTTPCATGLAFDESDEVGRSFGVLAAPFAGQKMELEIVGEPLFNEFPAFRHFYFVNICVPSDYVPKLAS